MEKVYHRFFAGLLLSQEKWLNEIADGGYRLKSTDKMTYTFEESADGWEYRVEYVGYMPRDEADGYADFLRELGCEVFFKNINLNYSFGKVYYNPFNKKGGRVVSDATTLNREILIIGKIKDGKPFQLRTSAHDKIKYTLALSYPWFGFTVVFTVCAVLLKSIPSAMAAAVFLIPSVFALVNLLRLKKEARLHE